MMFQNDPPGRSVPGLSKRWTSSSSSLEKAVLAAITRPLPAPRSTAINTFSELIVVIRFCGTDHFSQPIRMQLRIRDRREITRPDGGCRRFLLEYTAIRH